MKKILVPIDLSHESTWKAALPEAFELAGALKGEVTIMTVVPEVIGGLDWRYAIRGEREGSEELDVKGVVADAKTRLEQIGKEHAPKGASFNVVARYGTIYEEILNVADELEVNQIIMAAHRPSLSDYLIGPNTARVVRHAKCSVHVVRN
jgi:nucleotide-binding universal stress UspA family protein